MKVTSLVQSEGIIADSSYDYIALQHGLLQRSSRRFSDEPHTKPERSPQMSTIVGHTTYKEISPEELTRHLHEAELLRAEAVRDHFFALGRGIARVAGTIRHGLDGLIHPNTAGAR